MFFRKYNELKERNKNQCKTIDSSSKKLIEALEKNKKLKEENEKLKEENEKLKEKFIKKHNYVLTYDGYNKVHLYQDGKEIKSLTEVNFHADTMKIPYFEIKVC